MLNDKSVMSPRETLVKELEDSAATLVPALLDLASRPTEEALWKTMWKGVNLRAAAILLDSQHVYGRQRVREIWLTAEEKYLQELENQKGEHDLRIVSHDLTSEDTVKRGKAFSQMHRVYSKVSVLNFLQDQPVKLGGTQDLSYRRETVLNRSVDSKHKEIYFQLLCEEIDGLDRADSQEAEVEISNRHGDYLSGLFEGIRDGRAMYLGAGIPAEIKKRIYESSGNIHNPGRMEINSYARGQALKILVEGGSGSSYFAALLAIPHEADRMYTLAKRAWELADQGDKHRIEEIIAVCHKNQLLQDGDFLTALGGLERISKSQKEASKGILDSISNGLEEQLIDEVIPGFSALCTIGIAQELMHATGFSNHITLKYLLKLIYVKQAVQLSRPLLTKMLAKFFSMNSSTNDNVKYLSNRTNIIYDSLVALEETSSRLRDPFLEKHLQLLKRFLSIKDPEMIQIDFDEEFRWLQKALGRLEKDPVAQAMLQQTIRMADAARKSAVRIYRTDDKGYTLIPKFEHENKVKSYEEPSEQQAQELQELKDEFEAAILTGRRLGSMYSGGFIESGIGDLRHIFAGGIPDACGRSLARAFEKAARLESIPGFS